MAAGGTIAAIILALSHLAASSNAVSVKIKPDGDVQARKIGSGFALTCQPTSSDSNVISDTKWLDPRNQTIEPLSYTNRLRVLDLESDSEKNAASIKSDMYTEMQQDKLTLYFKSLKEHEAGLYTCVANYAVTETISKSVMIEAIESLRWVDAPENQYPILGKPFKIKCQVSSRPSPSVAWFMGNGTQISTGNHYVIETHALTIKKVVYSDEGIYECRATVTETGEYQERAIRVEIHEEPKIKEMSSSIEIIEGRTETITCEASGKPPPKYSWVKSVTSKNLSAADRFSVESDTGVLTITDVNREDEGEYECIATNAAGEAKTVITVVVNVKPKIMEFFNSTMAVGRNANITCKAFGKPVPQVTFRKHSSTRHYVLGAQQDDDRIVLTNSVTKNYETVGVLTINKVLRDDDGLYECIASNKVATAYKNGHLTVEFPPSFRFMNNKTIWSWDQRPVNLTCIAESIPNATIRWTLAGNEPINFDRDIKQIDSGPISTLMITRVDNRNYGGYKCHAENIHGRREILLHLKQASRPSEVLQSSISELTATTIAFNIVLPPSQEDLPLRSLTVQYKPQNTNWATAKNRTWSIGSPYILEGLKPQTYYNFRFLATNDVGDGNWGATLVESTPMRTTPNAPKIRSRMEDGPYVSSMFGNQFELKWITPPDNGEPIDLYEIRYCQVKRNAQDWESMEGTCRAVEIKGQRTTEWLKDLNSDTFYKAEIRAHNIIGYGNAGEVYFKTARGENVPRLHRGPLISSAAIIGIVIAILFLVIVVIDVICCCTHKTGIIFYVCERSRKKPVDEEDTKLGSLYGWRFPLPYCDQKMANVAGVTAIQDSGSGKNTIKLVKHTAIEEKEPLKEEKKITPIIDSGLRRETSITFDGTRSVSKTGFVGKDSAV